MLSEPGIRQAPAVLSPDGQRRSTTTERTMGGRSKHDVFCNTKKRTDEEEKTWPGNGRAEGWDTQEESLENDPSDLA